MNHDQHPAAHGHGRTRAPTWDESAESYALKADRLEPALRVATDAMLDAAHVRAGTRVLDLACGPGHSTGAALSRGAHVLGIEASAAMIATARRRYPEARFLTGNMLDPPAGDWDAIVSRFAAHHVDARWLDAAFRILKEGGRLAIAEVEPRPGTPPERAAGKVSASMWRRRFELAGFDDVRVQACEIPMPDADHGLSEWSSTWIISGRRPPREASPPREQGRAVSIPEVGA